MASQRPHGRRFVGSVSLLTVLSFLLCSGPIPAFAAEAERHGTQEERGERAASPSGELPPEEEPLSVVQVFSGHSWAKSWGPPPEEPEEQEGLDETETEQIAPATRHMRASNAGEPDSPTAAGLEQELKPKSFGKGLLQGFVLALLGFGSYELITRLSGPGQAPEQEPKVAVLPPVQEPPAPKKQELAPKKEELAPKKEEVPPKKEGPAPKKEVEPPIGEKKISPDSLLAGLDPAMKKRIQHWDAKTRELFKELRMSRPLTTSMGYKVQAYHSYREDPTHQWNQFLVDRFWSYDMGVTMHYLTRRGELKEARWLGEQMMDLAKQMAEDKQKGGWRFSYRGDFTDARAMAGAAAWVEDGLFEVGLRTKDKAVVDQATELLETVIFPLQVEDAKDPLDGLFRAGWGSGNEYDNSKSNLPRREVTTEHVWDIIKLLRTARRAIAEVRPDSPLLKEIDRRHERAMLASREKVLLTPERIQAQMDRLQKEGRITAKLRAQHERALAEIRKLPGQKRWATGMNPDGTLNIAWAYDNEVWSPHGAYDPELGYNELKNVESRFLLRLKAGQFSNLPKGVDRDRVFVGLRFFTGDFEDAHVPPNPKYEEMIQTEATWTYIFRLIQHGYHTAVPKEREWAYGLARELIGSMLGLNEIYGGAPYATLDIQDYFNTMLAVASNGHQGIVLADVLRGGAPADSYLNTLPHPEMRVGGQAPAWPAPKGVQPGKEEVRLPGAAQVEDAFLSILLPPAMARQLAGRTAVAELWNKGRAGGFIPVDEQRIGPDGLLQFHAPYVFGSEVLTGWTGPRSKIRVLVLDDAQADAQAQQAHAALVLEVGESDLEGNAPVTMRLASGLEQGRQRYWKGFLVGVAAAAAAWGIFRATVPVQEPAAVVPLEQPVQIAQKPAPPVKKLEEPAPIKKEEAPPPIKKEIEPPPVKKEVEPPVKKEPERPKAVPAKAVLDDFDLKVSLPPGLWAISYLKTDQWYAQEGIFQVPPSGKVTFTVVVSPPNRPGWVKARDRAVALFRTEEGATRSPQTAITPGGIRGAAAIITYSEKGEPTLVSGTLEPEPPKTKEKSPEEGARLQLRQDAALIHSALTGRGRPLRNQHLLGLGPSALQQHGRELVLFLDALKQASPAMDPFLVLVGPEASNYAENVSVLISAAGVEQAAVALSLLGAGVLQYASSDPEELAGLRFALQVRGAAIRIQPVDSADLPGILRLILVNLAGMEEQTPQDQVEQFYGVPLGRLAGTLKLLAQQGV